MKRCAVLLLSAFVFLGCENSIERKFGDDDFLFADDAEQGDFDSWDIPLDGDESDESQNTYDRDEDGSQNEDESVDESDNNQDIDSPDMAPDSDVIWNEDDSDENQHELESDGDQLPNNGDSDWESDFDANDEYLIDEDNAEPDLDDEEFDDSDSAGECTVISFSSLVMHQQNSNQLEAQLELNIEGDAVDNFILEFVGHQKINESYKLGVGDNETCETCSQCVQVIADTRELEHSVRYFGTEGTVTITNIENSTDGRIVSGSKGFYSKIRLDEVEFSTGDTGKKHMEIKENGSCLIVEPGSWDTLSGTPDCTGKVCGDDGYGGSCGSCGEDKRCSDAGKQCLFMTPQCDGKECGDDSAGGSCGTCEFGSSCSPEGTCLDCTEIEIGEMSGEFSSYSAPLLSNIGVVDGDDSFVMQFWREKYGYLDYPLTVDLGSESNRQYNTATEALFIMEDINEEAKTGKMYFQSAGTLVVDKAVPRDYGYFTGQSAGYIRNVQFDEARVFMKSGEYLSEYMNTGVCYVVRNKDWDTICYPKCTNTDGSTKVCGDDGCGGTCGSACGVGKVCNDEQSACIDRQCEVVSVEEIRHHDGYTQFEMYYADLTDDFDKKTSTDKEVEDNNDNLEFERVYRDRMRIEFKNKIGEKFMAKAGTYDLGTYENQNGETCKTCVSIELDPMSGRRFFQETGKLVVEESTEFGKSRGYMENVRFVEAKFEPSGISTNEITVVPGGDCFLVKRFDWNTICTPQCDGKVCGDDGCGGNCRDGCGFNQECRDDQTKCVASSCTPVTLEQIAVNGGWGPVSYHATYSPNTGDAAKADAFKMTFANAKEWGRFDLSAEPEDGCVHCLNIEEDDSSKMYKAVSGSLKIDKVDFDVYGMIAEKSAGKMENVVFAELDSDSNVVDGGKCLAVKEAAWDTMCVPQCDGKVCRDDGCGGTCGDGCGVDQYCNAEQTSCVDYSCQQITVKSIAHDSFSNYTMVIDDVDGEGADSLSMTLSNVAAGITYSLNSSINKPSSHDQYITLNVNDLAYSCYPQKGLVSIEKVGAGDGETKGSFKNVRLIEYGIVGWEGFNPIQGIVVGGKCFELTDGSWDNMPN